MNKLVLGARLAGILCASYAANALLHPKQYVPQVAVAHPLDRTRLKLSVDCGLELMQRSNVRGNYSACAALSAYGPLPSRKLYK